MARCGPGTPAAGDRRLAGTHSGLVTAAPLVQHAVMVASNNPSFTRNVVLGAVVGAIIGLVVGGIARALVGSGTLLIYEIVAGAAGVVLGAILGAFYGGALSLPRRDH